MGVVVGAWGCEEDDGCDEMEAWTSGGKRAWVEQRLRECIIEGVETQLFVGFLVGFVYILCHQRKLSEQLRNMTRVKSFRQVTRLLPIDVVQCCLRLLVQLIQPSDLFQEALLIESPGEERKTTVPVGLHHLGGFSVILAKWLTFSLHAVQRS